MILSTNEITQQSHKISIYLVVFYDLYSQKFSPCHKNIPPTDLLLLIATGGVTSPQFPCARCVWLVLLSFQLPYIKFKRKIFISQVTHVKG